MTTKTSQVHNLTFPLCKTKVQLKSRSLAWEKLSLNCKSQRVLMMVLFCTYTPFIHEAPDVELKSQFLSWQVIHSAAKMAAHLLFKWKNRAIIFIHQKSVSIVLCSEGPSQFAFTC